MIGFSPFEERHALEPHAGPRDEEWSGFEIICAGMRGSDEPSQLRNIRTISLVTGYGCVRPTPIQKLLALECMSFRSWAIESLIDDLLRNAQWRDSQ